MARGRPRKTAEDVLVKSAEFVGWALGGLEREIAQTRERLAALNAHAVKLRARAGKGEAAAAKKAEASGATHAAEAPMSRRQRRRQMSEEARQRISAAMTKRWAERRKEKP